MMLYDRFFPTTVYFSPSYISFFCSVSSLIPSVVWRSFARVIKIEHTWIIFTLETHNNLKLIFYRLFCIIIKNLRISSPSKLNLYFLMIEVKTIVRRQCIYRNYWKIYVCITESFRYFFFSFKYLFKWNINKCHLSDRYLLFNQIDFSCKESVLIAYLLQFFTLFVCLSSSVFFLNVLFFAPQGHFLLLNHVV